MPVSLAPSRMSFGSWIGDVALALERDAVERALGGLPFVDESRGEGLAGIRVGAFVGGGEAEPPVLVARDELLVLGEHEDGRFRESELLLGGEPRADDHVGADLRPPPIPMMHEVGDGHVAPVVIVVAAAVVGFGGTVVGDNGPNGAGRNRRKPEELLGLIVSVERAADAGTP